MTTRIMVPTVSDIRLIARWAASLPAAVGCVLRRARLTRSPADTAHRSHAPDKPRSAPLPSLPLQACTGRWRTSALVSAPWLPLVPLLSLKVLRVLDALKQMLPILGHQVGALLKVGLWPPIPTTAQATAD